MTILKKNFALVILSLAFAFALILPSSAFAAMPNFVGTGYYLPPCEIGDHSILEFVDSIRQETGCTPREELIASKVLAASLQENGVVFKPGEVIRYTNGATETVPFWIPMGLVVDSSKVIR